MAGVTSSSLAIGQILPRKQFWVSSWNDKLSVFHLNYFKEILSQDED
jgi:hypothetical protein